MGFINQLYSNLEVSIDWRSPSSLDAYKIMEAIHL